MNWLRNIAKRTKGWFHALSPTCKEAARLQSAALDRPLAPMEKFGLRFHVLICRWCSAYGKQIKFLRWVAGKNDPVADKKEARPSLSREARERIKRTLRSGID
jgi:hypothetical protein